MFAKVFLGIVGVLLARGVGSPEQSISRGGGGGLDSVLGPLPFVLHCCASHLLCHAKYDHMHVHRKQFALNPLCAETTVPVTCVP